MARRSFTTTFVIALVPQAVIWILYWFFGIDSSGRETTFQRNLLWFYWPVVFLIDQFQYAIGWQTWVSLGIQVIFGPLIRALIYSALFAYAVHTLRRGRGGKRSAA